MEVLNDLLGYPRKIYQDTDYFCFTLDSVLLSNFIHIKKTTRKILDIGTGTGSIPLFLSMKTSAHIDAIEIQKELFQLCKKSVYYNHLEEQIQVIHNDVNNYSSNIHNYYDIIVSNPPYFKWGKENKSNQKAIAKHEICLVLSDLIKVSKKMLKNNGSLVLIYSSERFLEVMKELEKNNLVPKRIQFIHEDLNKEASVVLIESVLNGKPGLKIESPFVLYNEDGEYSLSYKKILSGDDLNESKEL